MTIHNFPKSLANFAVMNMIQCVCYVMSISMILLGFILLHGQARIDKIKYNLHQPKKFSRKKIKR